MSTPTERMGPSRHPWLARFESAPEEAFGELLAGYADIHPYERADAPDAARMLFGPLDPKDSARSALGPAVLAWLEKRRKEPLPAARPKLQRRVREICEALEIIALLNLEDAAVELRRRFVIWNDWMARLVLSSARDARAEYWRMLALTQTLVAKAAPDIDANGLAAMWQRICSEAGGRLPRHYLSIGLLGLRRLPEVGEGSELSWVSGLAQWALAQKPSDSEFKAEWLALKPLYPRAPQRWRRFIAKLLSATTFKDAEIEPPEWWRVDPDFAPMMQENFTTSEAPLRSPMPQDCNRVIRTLGDRFENVERLIDELFQNHRRYLSATGDAQYFVRAIHSLGRELIERGGDNPHARAQKAQSLAREGLRWQPYDRYLSSLWRDALVADNAPEAAELIGWEFVRRDPTDPEARTQLATLLANSLNKFDEAETLLKETVQKFPDNVPARSQLATLLGNSLDKFDEAEALLKETIERFPDDAHAYTQLSELLIAEDRISEATSVLDAAFNAEAVTAATYAVRARIYSHESRLEDARNNVNSGLELESSNAVLREFEQRLSRHESLPLKSRAFAQADIRQAEAWPRTTAISDPEFAEVARLGAMRRLRFQLECGPGNEREVATQELRRILREDPTFAYAELLAARHRIWEANSDVLPSFAAAFEDALATEDREKLEKLVARQPRLEALILVARSVLGDSEAATKVELWLRAPQTVDKEPAIAGLRLGLRPVLKVIEGGRSAVNAIAEMRETVVRALHDANEATLGEALLAA
jgi:Flp pilus assembly protein TadD